jgi:hypothetical protein
VGVLTILVFLVLALPGAADPVCATKYSDLDATDNLKALKLMFSADKQIAMVNETKGSYVIISGFEDNLTISFFTSGIFDLYPIRRDGPLKFCDDGVVLRMIGLGREETFTMMNGGVQMGKAGAKRSFARGEMPDLLKRLHKMDIRGIASESPR